MAIGAGGDDDCSGFFAFFLMNMSPTDYPTSEWITNLGEFIVTNTGDNIIFNPG